MRAFQIVLNDKKLWVAGIGKDGVLTAIITYAPVHNRGKARVSVGGLVLPQDEHVRWRHASLRVGDEIRLKTVEATKVDKPRARVRRNPAAEIEAKKRYVRKLAKDFGWQIQEGRKSG